MGNLRIRTPRLELSVSSERLEDLVRVANDGVHDPSVMPFGTPWTDRTDPGGEVRAWWLRQQVKRADSDWSLPFIVSSGDVVIGQQTLSAKDFPVLREVSTGSWLGLGFQGKGFGTEMRTAVLYLAFMHFEAEYARTTAMWDNFASRTINMRLGYSENGESRVAVRGKAALEIHYLLEYQRWRECYRRWLKWNAPVEVVGLGV